MVSPLFWGDENDDDDYDNNAFYNDSSDISDGDGMLFDLVIITGKSEGLLVVRMMIMWSYCCL